MHKHSKFTVLAYITAYQDPTALQQCLDRALNQTHPIQALFILDNSPTPLLPNCQHPNLTTLYRHHPENLGIAAGIQQAVAYAIAHRYDYLWLFDQDSRPEPTCLETLLHHHAQLCQYYNVGIIAPTAIDDRTNTIIQGANFDRDQFIGYPPPDSSEPYPCDAPITSGSLLSLAALQAVPPPRAELFIDGVDLDYGLRLKQAGFHNFIVPTALLKHNFGSPQTVRFLHKTRTYYPYSALRHYYIARNYTYLETRNAKGFYKLTSSARRLKYLVYTAAKIALWDSEPSEKLKKIAKVFQGTYHGFLGALSEEVKF